MDGKNGTVAHIPVIDVSEHTQEVGDNLIAAVIKWGFVYVRGETGFSSDVIERIFAIVCIHQCHKCKNLRAYVKL